MAAPRHTPTITVRVLPHGEPLTFNGRSAETMRFLIERGAVGFTTGEASGGWARRVSAYVHTLRMAGIPIAMERESVPGASVGRYSLAGPVAVVRQAAGPAVSDGRVVNLATRRPTASAQHFRAAA